VCSFWFRIGPAQIGSDWSSSVWIFVKFGLRSGPELDRSVRWTASMNRIWAEFGQTVPHCWPHMNVGNSVLMPKKKIMGKEAARSCVSCHWVWADRAALLPSRMRRDGLDRSSPGIFRSSVCPLPRIRSSVHAGPVRSGPILNRCTPLLIIRMLRVWVQVIWYLKII